MNAFVATGAPKLEKFLVSHLAQSLWNTLFYFCFLRLPLVEQTREKKPQLWNKMWNSLPGRNRMVFALFMFRKNQNVCWKFGQWLTYTEGGGEWLPLPQSCSAVIGCFCLAGTWMRSIETSFCGMDWLSTSTYVRTSMRALWPATFDVCLRQYTVSRP